LYNFEYIKRVEIKQKTNLKQGKRKAQTNTVFTKSGFNVENK
jgi:hypothetical protein